MKNKILIFIIGALIGCIIATVGYYIYESVSSKNSSDQFHGGMNGGPNMEQMSPPDGEMPNGEEPPAKPSEENTETTTQNTENNTSSQNTQKTKKNKTTNTENTTNNSQTQTN